MKIGGTYHINETYLEGSVQNLWLVDDYHLGICDSLLLNITIEIADLPMKHGDSTHSSANVYQRAS